MVARRWKRSGLGLVLSAACVAISSCAPAVRDAPPPRSSDIPTLRQLADGRSFDIGASVRVRPLKNQEPYRQTLAREFNTVTAGNAMKFGPIHRERDRYTFEAADGVVEFAEEHGMKVRGHTLVWHQQNARWLRDGTFARDELVDVLRDHVTTVVARYRGRVFAWDVVNEAIDVGEPDSLRRGVWRDTIGPEYIDMAFRWAREADPKAKLFYNDYGIEGKNSKANAAYELVRGMVERGVPIDGVGLQMHIRINDYPSPHALRANMERYGELGLEVHVTEMDVQIYNGVGSREERLAAQAMVYRDMLALCLGSEACTAFVTWGFTDRFTWIPRFFRHPDSPLPFDADYRPKPAYYGMHEALADTTD